MSILEDIFTEYVRMRDNGMDARDTLRALRPYVEPLPKPEKESLAQMLRAWEKGDNDNEPSEPERKSSVIRPLKSERPASSGVAAFTDTEGVTPPQDTATWVSCSNCGKKNRMSDVFCYACGHMLEMPRGEFDTQHFEDADSNLFSDDYFGPESVMILHFRDANFDFELRPQLSNHEVIVGRSTDNSAMAPDVDLAELNAAEFGVSRLHLSMMHEAQHNAIRIYDLGSANGSYINGQKLHPKEVRMLRSGDELRLGKLVINIYFSHPGNALD